MTVDQMRAKISAAYDGPKWRNRVSVMEDRQVIAIFKTMTQLGTLEHKRKRRDGVQTCMFDPGWSPNGPAT